MRPVKTIQRISSGKQLYKNHPRGSRGILNYCSPASLPYCALYNYAHGSVGYGCAEYPGYTSTVLLSPVTTALGTMTGINSSSNSTSQIPPTASSTGSTTATPSPSVSHGLSSGGIAGVAIGSIAVVVAICLLIFLVWSHKRKNPQAARQSYTGTTAVSSTVHPSTDYSGTRFAFSSPKSPPWDWGSTGRHSTGPIEMVRETAQLISL
jgi:hypothetical protein